MIFEFTEEARDQLAHWQRHDRAKVKRIKTLLEAVAVNAFAGIGKPEPLKFALAGHWSRRIDQEHRLVYRVDAEVCTVVACRFHYDRQGKAT